MKKTKKKVYYKDFIYLWWILQQATIIQNTFTIAAYLVDTIL